MKFNASPSIALICLMIFLFCSGTIHSQVLNADRFGKKVDSTKTFRGDFSLGLELNKQNELILTLTAGAEMSYLLSNNVIIFKSSFDLLRSGDDNLRESGYAHLRLRMLLDKWYNPEFFTQAQIDGVRGLKERYLAGGNVRFRISSTEKGSVYLGMGAMFEREIWSSSGVAPEIMQPYDTRCRTTDCTSDLVKINSYLSITRKLTDAVGLNLVVYGQGVPDVNIQSPRIAGDVSLDFKITKNVKFSVQYDMIYDFAPPVPIDNFYFNMNNLLTVSW